MQKSPGALALALLVSIVLGSSLPANSADDKISDIHKKRTGVVTKGSSDSLAVKSSDGATYQINPSVSKRHGHEPVKEGDEVTFTLDENNTVIDLHPKGQEGHHTYVTGKLIYVGKMKNEIKLKTKEGEKSIPSNAWK